MEILHSYSLINIYTPPPISRPPSPFLFLFIMRALCHEMYALVYKDFNISNCVVTKQPFLYIDKNIDLKDGLHSMFLKPRSHLTEYFFRLFTIEINSAIAHNPKPIRMM